MTRFLGGRCGLLLLAVPFIGAALFTVTGCKDDDPTDPGPATAGLATVWPNEDGNSWTYSLRVEQRMWKMTPADSVEAVPPLPAMDVLYAEFLEPLPAAVLDSAQAVYSQTFDGEITTDSGVTAQNLVEVTEEIPAVTGARPGPPAWIRVLASARPDLAPRLTDLYGPAIGDPAAKDLDLMNPIFLEGYAWELNDEAIVGYGDLTTAPSWLHLTSDLSLGATFRFQLVAPLADDIFLHGRIVKRGPATYDGHTYDDVVVCFYAIDLGISEMTDESGNLPGCYRPYMTGIVVYVPGVGPVASQDRRYVDSGDLAFPTDPTMEVFSVTAVMTETNVGD